jgi:2-oxoisovalerate dehydrogenase E1 component
LKPAKLVLLADTLVVLHRQMLRIRRCEERLVKSFHEGLIHGQYFSSLGQEAVAVGVCHHLRADDVVFSTHRGQGHALAKGMDLGPLIAELYGRAKGCSGGRAGPFFLCDPAKGLLGTSGIVGASILQATGAAYAMRMMGSDRVAVAFFGDGAACCGAFHEGLNLASMWQLPVLFICENNQFAGRMRTSEISADVHFAHRAKHYDMPGVEVDGNDVAQVYAAAFEAVRRARDGRGPTLLECVTMRLRPHAEGDAGGGSPTQEELDKWIAKDPVKRLADRLLSSEFTTSAELATIDLEVRQEIEKAHISAMRSAWPEPVRVRVADDET